MIDALVDLIHRMEPEAFLGLMIPISVVVGGILMVIIGMIFHHLRYSRDASMKQEMIAQGMSADDIERVLAAKSSSCPSPSSGSPGSIRVNQFVGK